MTIKAQGSGLKTALATITTLKAVYAPHERKGSYSEFPCAVINVGPVDYPENVYNNRAHTIFKVAILLASLDLPTKFNDIIDYYENTGTESVRAAIVADVTLSGACDRAWVRSASGDSWITVGGVLYLGVEFEVEVLSSYA